LLALFSGARLNELAPMRVDDIKHDAASDVHFMTVIEDGEAGRSVKTETSLRAVPIHRELKRIGILELVDHRRQADGPKARLFPLVQANSKGNYGAGFSQWFGRYKRSLGIDNPSSVFHSFRHGFKDALRAAGVNEDVNDALMVRRFGFPTLAAAVEKVEYPGVDLAKLRWTASQASSGEAA
jgi:integrase